MENKITLEVFKTKHLHEGSALQRLQQLDDPENLLPDNLVEWNLFQSKNPLLAGEEDLLVIAVKANKVVGRLQMGRCQAYYERQISNLVYLQGFLVSQADRKSGIGAMMLLRAVRSGLPIIASGAPDPSCKQLYQASGMKLTAITRRFILPFRTNPFAEWLTKNPVSRTLLTLAGNLFLRPILSLGLRKQDASIAIKPVDTLPASIDHIPSTKDSHSCFNSAAYLNWVLSAGKSKAFLVTRDQQLVGYVLVMKYELKGQHSSRTLPRATVGALLDYRIHQADAKVYRQVIREVAIYLRKEGIDLMECQSNEEAFCRACKKLFMVEKGGLKVFFSPGAKHIKNVPPDNHQWVFTYGTGDVILRGQNWQDHH